MVPLRFLLHLLWVLLSLHQGPSPLSSLPLFSLLLSHLLLTQPVPQHLLFLEPYRLPLFLPPHMPLLLQSAFPLGGLLHLHPTPLPCTCFLRWMSLSFSLPGRPLQLPPISLLFTCFLLWILLSFSLPGRLLQLPPTSLLFTCFLLWILLSYSLPGRLLQLPPMSLLFTCFLLWMLLSHSLTGHPLHLLRVGGALWPPVPLLQLQHLLQPLLHQPRPPAVRLSLLLLLPSCWEWLC
jgi:hypothetical protein